MIWIIFTIILGIISIPVISGLTGDYNLMKIFGVTYTDVLEIDTIENDIEKELKEINKDERIEIIDQTIVKYNRLIDSLTMQYNAETDEKKKAAILSKQISALEKLNRALEKREKLE